jgi:YHS domain-containing protein
MLRTLFEELVIPLLLILLVRSLLRGWLGAGSRRTPAPRRPEQDLPRAAELKKDPVCGTYVSASTGFTRTVNGQVIYFCSKECRDKYTSV